ncbi:serine/threonine-protein kinase [Gordonia sp. (in: high G+C Gram-positive bacteria)]|uniref:serine/threonine-protein kinase n=1 Tax=Gordonia sp. (in: high G+C Gram-positive bacteria) TaxID=84139 RepID=UPI002610B2AC|nr:serine/threonine protein kinase [Gordonia sp. (in: high G+C Gram-positive bacteria)]
MNTGDRRGTQLGPYRLVRLLGRGGMGEVYEAVDTVKDRTVALKLLPPQLSGDDDFRTRFLRESQTTAKLHDPHVIPIHDYGEIDGQLYLDMRIVRGDDLRALVRQGPVPAERAVDIVSQIAGALDSAHDAGLTHRDVKPENILLDKGGFAYLVDFGLVQSAGQTSLTATGAAIGSFNYMAPERFGAGAPGTAVGPASDTYALACVLYECLTGAKPFGATSMEQIIAGHLHRPLPSTGTAFDAVIARGTAKDPAQRYPTTGAFAADARRVLAGSPPALPAPPPAASFTAEAPTGPTPAGAYPVTGSAGFTTPTYPHPVGAAGYPPASRRDAPNTALLTIAAVVAVLALAVVGIWLWPRGDDSHQTTTAAGDVTVTETSPATSPSADEAPAGTVTRTQNPIPQAPPGTTTARGVGDLGLSTPISTPPCDGRIITIVQSPLGDAPVAEVQAALDKYEGSQYLRADQSCSSLRPRDEHGNVIYAVYYDGCSKKYRYPGSYGRRLENSGVTGVEVC